MDQHHGWSNVFFRKSLDHLSKAQVIREDELLPGRIRVAIVAFNRPSMDVSGTVGGQKRSGNTFAWTSQGSIGSSRSLSQGNYQISEVSLFHCIFHPCPITIHSVHVTLYTSDIICFNNFYYLTSGAVNISNRHAYFTPFCVV